MSTGTWPAGQPYWLTIQGSCPKCGTSPAYRIVHPDPWDRHETCPECGYCYLHEGKP